MIVNKVLIGVFISNSQREAFSKQNPAFNYLALEDANQKAGTTLYFFSNKDIDLYKRKINGFYFNNESGLWEQKKFPFPQVLYHRSGRIKKKYKDIFIKTGMAMVNPIFGFFDKCKVNDIFQNNENVRPYLPYTVMYHNISDLNNMLQSFDKLYLKACKGSKGKQVMLIKKLSNGHYECNYFLMN